MRWTPSEGGSQHDKCYFNIGSVESFEQKLEDAQEALSIGPHDSVPVTYVSKMVWYQELLRYAPILLIPRSLIYFGRRIQSGFGVREPRGKGGCGLFNINKIV